MKDKKNRTNQKSLKGYVERIHLIASKARSEAKLEGEMNQIMKDCLTEFGVDFDPHVNETLKSMGLAQVDAHRPDGVFGHIVYDYKLPETLSNPVRLKAAKAQMEKYLNRISGGHDVEDNTCSDWFGYLCDGSSFVYCRSNGSEWRWSRRLHISESSLLFIVHAYRSLGRRPLTAKLLSEAFGKGSDVAKELIRVMCAHLAKPRHKTNMLLQEWKRLFQQVSTYGLDQLPSLKQWAISNGIATKDASHILFAMHSYYSLVVKILTSELLSISSHSTFSVSEEITASSTIDEVFGVLTRIENGEYYKRYRITNFLEGDFFSWYMNERSRFLANAIQDVAREFLLFEPASAILLPEAKQDLLKEFYSSLVDEQIRHDLGEYYTPDWLAQHLLDQSGYSGDPASRLLDPACGSGTFLVEAITRLKKTCDERGMKQLEILETILSNIKGLDLNPLAVISARANYILSIYDLVFELGYDIELPVYLADSINVPVEKRDSEGNCYLEYSLDTEIEAFTLEIPSEFVQASVLGKVLLACENAILQGHNFEQFLHTISKQSEIEKLLSPSVLMRLERFFAVIQSLEAREWDKIWCRIIKNNFSPRGFARFDFIVGNPPWVRWSRLPTTYRNRVKAFCNYYGLVSGRGYSGGIESDISTVITFSAADNWLAEGGTIAFLITWPVFKSGSARGFRLCTLPNNDGLRISHIEDLTRLQPFPDATNQTSIYIAQKVERACQARFDQTSCGIWEIESRRSRVPPGTPLSTVKQWSIIKSGVASPVADWGSPLFTGDISHFKASSFLRGNSPYLNLAHRGTISDAARIFWVKVLKYSPDTNRALIRTLNAEELPIARVYDTVEAAWIEADLLHPLVRGRDVGRYSHKTEGWYQLIPNTHYENVETEDEFADLYPLTYSYLRNYENILRNRSSYKRYQRHLPFYVIYCIGDYSFASYKVVWPEQQNPKEFRASVIDLSEDQPLFKRIAVPDHKLYFISLESLEEAHYVCAFLNSAAVRIWLGGFLLGSQIGTTIFEYMRVPKFDPKNPHCLAMAKISRIAHGDRHGLRSIDTLDPQIEERLAQHVRAVCG